MRVSKCGVYAVLMALAAAACDSSDDPASNEGTGGAGGVAGSGGAAGVAGVAGAGGSTDGGGATGGTAGSDGAAGASGDWSCLGKVTYPPAPAATAAVSLTYFHAPKAFDPTGYVPFANVDVAACPDGDPSCASPVAEGKTDAQGTVVLTLPTPGTGFAGFLRASGGGAGKTLLLQRPPIRAQGDVLFTQLIVPSPAASDALVKAAGKQPDASKAASRRSPTTAPTTRPSRSPSPQQAARRPPISRGAARSTSRSLPTRCSSTSHQASSRSR